MIIIKWSKALFLSAVVVMLSAGATSLSAQSGEYAYVATTAGGVSAFTIDQATGALTQLAGRALVQLPANNSSGSVAIDSTARFLFVTSCPPRGRGDLTCDTAPVTLLAFAIGHKGDLTLAPDSPFSIGVDPTWIATDPAGKFLYVQSGGSIYAFAIDQASGGLTAVPGSPFGFNAVGGRYRSGHGSPWSVPIYCERPAQHLCKS